MEFRVAFIGNSKSGKTRMCEKLCGIKSQNTYSTINQQIFKFNINDVTIKILDTPGKLQHRLNEKYDLGQALITYNPDLVIIFESSNMSKDIQDGNLDLFQWKGLVKVYLGEKLRIINVKDIDTKIIKLIIFDIISKYRSMKIM